MEPQDAKQTMSLCRFAADSLVRDYLHGRVLPRTVHDAVVALAEQRLIAGRLPVIDNSLRQEIDEEATEARRLVSS